MRVSHTISALTKPRTTVMTVFPRSGNATCRAYNDDNIKTNDLAPSTRNNRISPIKGSASSTASNYNSYTGTDLKGTINGSGKTGHQYVNGNGSVHAVSKKPEIRLSSVPTSPVSEKRVVPEVPNTSRVGKYTILRTVGRGNFAQVKLAVHLTTGCEVAIKMIDKTSLSENCLIKLAREVRVLKSLSHPNVVRLYEVIETTRHVYMVMEYAKNGEVFEHLLKAGRMAETKVRVIFRQLFSAVEYCHKKNIVHRDLKAENLLLDSNNNLKLADFGFANTFKAGNTLDTFCGSPPYAAPELLCGQKYHGPEVDVWALGVILYMLVCGQLPFEAFTLKELHSRVLSGKYRIPFYMSGDCEAILKKMLVLNPTKRATLRELMKEKWINIGYENDPLQPYVEPQMDYNDPIRRAIMNELGFSPEDLQDAFENYRFNNVTATYLLLADTETRHRITRKLQNHQNDWWKTVPTAPCNLSSDLDAESFDDDPTLDLRQRSRSAVVSTAAATIDPRGRTSWVTGSLRDRDSQNTSKFYSQPNKHLLRPSLNLPRLIATADKPEKSLPRLPVSMEQQSRRTPRPKPCTTDAEYAAEVSDVEVDKVSVKSPNGLRRFRTPSLETKKERLGSTNSTTSNNSNNVTVSAEVTLRKTEIPGPTKLERNQTDPLIRREIPRPQPTARSRSIVIVSDKPQANGRKLSGESIRKLPRVMPPTEVKYPGSRNTPVDLFNPDERDTYFSQAHRMTASPQNQRAYKYNTANRVLPYSDSVGRSDDRQFSYEDPSHVDETNSSSTEKPEPMIIIVSEKNNASCTKPTRLLTSVTKPNIQPRYRMSRAESERLNQLSHDELSEPSRSAHSRTDRMPKWRRYTAELPRNVDKPPTPAPRSVFRDTVGANGYDPGRRLMHNFNGTIQTNRQKSNDINDMKQRTIEVNLNGSNNVHSKANWYQRLHNGTAQENSESLYPNSNSRTKPNGLSNHDTGGLRLVHSSSANGLDAPSCIAEPKGSVTMNGVSSPTRTIHIDSDVNRSPVLNREKRPSISHCSSLRSERHFTSPVIAWATARLKDAPTQMHGWDAKNSTNLTGSSRFQTHGRGSAELAKPTSLLTSSSVVTPEFTRIYNGTNSYPASAGRESRNSDGRQSELSFQKPSRTITDCRGVESNVTRKPSFIMSPPLTDQRTSPATAAPRRQEWAFGISVLGCNSQVLMHSTLRILEDKEIDYAYLGPYRLICTHPRVESSDKTVRDSVNRATNTVKWEIEIVQVPQMDSYGVRFKYISGATTRYRALEQWIINEYPKDTV